MSAHTARAGVKIARRELRFDPAMGLPLAVMLTSALALAVYVGQKEVREKAARRAPRENAPTARPHPSFLRPRARAVQMGARPAQGLAHQRGGGGRRGAAGSRHAAGAPAPRRARALPQVMAAAGGPPAAAAEIERLSARVEHCALSIFALHVPLTLSFVCASTPSSRVA